MSRTWAPKKYLIKALKIVSWIVGSIVLLLILLALAIQIPFVQNKITQRATSFLEEKVGTTVTLQNFSLSFPKKVVLKGIYLEDQSKDTLLYAGRIAINTNLWGLFNKKISLDEIEIDNLSANVSRSARDSAFNFDYIINAFATEAVAEVDTSRSDWAFSIEEIALTVIRVTYKDNLQGDDIRLQFGSLEVGIDEFDLQKSRVKVNSVNLADLTANITQTPPPPANEIKPSPETAPVDFDFDISTVSLNTIVADYSHSGTGQIVHLNLGEFILRAHSIDLQSQVIKLESFSLSDTFISYQESSPDETSGNNSNAGANDSPVEKTKPWSFSLDKLSLSNNNVQYHNFDIPLKKGSLDFDHLWMTRVYADAEDIKLKGNAVEGKVNSLSLLEKSGFGITSFKTSFSLTDSSLLVKDFFLQSPQSQIALNATSQFPSISALGDEYPNARVNLDINNSVISIKDILFFNPAILESIPLTVPKNASIKIDASMQGLVKDLKIKHLTINALNETNLKASGSLTGLTDKNVLMNIQLDTFYTTSSDIKILIPDSLLPGTIQLPQWIALTGTFKGTLSSPQIECFISSEFGSVALAGELNSNPITSSDEYEGFVDLTSIQLGKILNQEETMGELNMHASIKGAGLTMNDLNTTIDVNIYDFEYMGYTYKDFTLNGKMEQYFFSGTAVLEDQNLDFSLSGDMNYNSEVPAYEVTFQLNNADFQALNISERPLKARGTIEVNLATSDFRTINGKVDVRKVAIYNGDALYAVDSLLFISIDQKGESSISIRSDILSGDFAGTINLFSMSETLKRHFSNYFSLQDSLYAKAADPQNFSFNLLLKNTDLLTEIILPELEEFVPGRIEGAYDSEEEKLDLHVNFGKIKYNGIGIDSLKFSATSDINALDYGLTIKNIELDTLHIETIKLTGNVANDSIRSKFIILDSLKRNKYVLGGAFYSFEDTFQFQLLSDEVVINYGSWQTPPDNYLKFTNESIIAHNFSIININEKISILTQQNSDSTTSIVFKDLNLQNIANLIEGTVLADGLVNGNFNLASKGAFNSDIGIKDLEIFEKPWGDLSLLVEQNASGPLGIDLNLEGENARVKIDGYLGSQTPTPEINFTATLSKLNPVILEPFAGGQLKNSKGDVRGELKLTGSFAQPSLRGSLSFHEVSFVPSFVNSKFLLRQETISFTDAGIVLNDFNVLDEKNNRATLKGSIKTSTYQDFDLALTLAARNFQLINTTEGENDLFFGKVGINTNARINGNLTHPRITMEVSLSEESELTYIVPQSEKGILEQKGVVVFIDKSAKDDPFLSAIDVTDTLKSSFRGLDLTANIELSDKEMLSIIIDPVTGDKLSVKGNSTLTLDIDPTGDIQLAGRYEITEGTYDLTFYKLVKRNFLIEKGSTINWSGDPLNATMDIKASFQVETSPMELVSNQLTTNNAQELNLYRQRLPFLVYLKIKGNLLTPEISFELDMPVDQRNAFGGSIYAKLKDINTRESDLNKQVFALLILRRFIADNLFETQSGSTVSSTARRSVSKLLTEQLNRLSENIKGVELTFDVKSYEDYSSGSAQGQTEVQLGVSKSLLDDRLIVKVSGNVDVEGNASNQNSLTEYIGDLALEYKLTEDGRFRVTGFRNSNFDIIDGELIETGAGLIYIKDYNTLRELFKANAKEN